MSADGPLLYLDTSALARLYTDEPGRALVLAEVNAARELSAHLIAYAEMRATFAGRVRRKLLGKRRSLEVLARFERDWRQFTRVSVTEDLVQSAGELAEKHGLRAYDAVHLAAALALQPLGVRFLTFDQNLYAAAVAELGGAVVPLASA